MLAQGTSNLTQSTIDSGLKRVFKEVKLLQAWLKRQKVKLVTSLPPPSTSPLELPSPPTVVNQTGTSLDIFFPREKFYQPTLLAFGFGPKRYVTPPD